MSRVGARRERERAVPRATGVPRLAKPARHARYARVAPRSFGACRRPGARPLRVRLPPPHLRHARSFQQAESWVALLARSPSFQPAAACLAPGASGSYAAFSRRLEHRERRGLMRSILLRAGLTVSLVTFAACGG